MISNGNKLKEGGRLGNNDQQWEQTKRGGRLGNNDQQWEQTKKGSRLRCHHWHLMGKSPLASDGKVTIGL